MAAPLHLEVAEPHVAQALNLLHREGEHTVFLVRQ